MYAIKMGRAYYFELNFSTFHKDGYILHFEAKLSVQKVTFFHRA